MQVKVCKYKVKNGRLTLSTRAGYIKKAVKKVSIKEGEKDRVYK